MREPKKILVVTLSNLGDVVLTLPVFTSLLQAYPKAAIDAIVGPSGRAVLESDNRLRRVILYDKKKGWTEKWRLLLRVRGERYDLIIDLRHSLIGLFGGAKHRGRYWRSRPRVGHRTLVHLESLRGRVPAWTQESFLKARSAVAPPELPPAGQKFVVAAVGSKSDIKKWPPRRFAALLDRLSFDKGYKVLLAGDQADVEDAAAVKQLMASPVTDLTGRTSFDELCALLARAALVITNDSAPLHIADSLKAPVLALFGPTDPRKYGPRHPGSVAVSRGLFCSPCEVAQCRYHHECLEGMTEDEVWQKAERILSDAPPQKGLKILVTRLDRIGDVTLSLGAIRLLKQTHPDARISVMLRPQTRELLDGQPAVDEVLEYDYKKGGRHVFPLGYLRLLREIIRRRFDVVFILHPGVRSTLLTFLAGIPYRVGYKNRWSFLQTVAVEDRRSNGVQHESEYAMDLVRSFGAVADQAPLPELIVSALESAKIGNQMGEGRFIALHPGSSCPSKRWELSRFEALAKKIARDYPHRFVTIGGKEEIEMGRSLKVAVGDRLLDLTGQLTLKELSAALSRCELLISNDSGPVHVAAAVGTRVISLFGRNQTGLSPRRWRPLGDGHTVIQKDVGCVVCLAHECPIEFECLKAITVDEVYDAVRQQLSSPEKKRSKEPVEV